jgi:hypothetical protein
MSRPEPSFSIYVSDHGENLNDTGDKNYGHGTKELTRFELEVPFVVFMNDAFLEGHAKAAEALRARSGQPVCHDNVAHTLMGVAGISDPFVYRPELDVSSPSFRPGPRPITDENMNPFDYAAYDFSKKGSWPSSKATAEDTSRHSPGSVDLEGSRRVSDSKWRCREHVEMPLLPNGVAHSP